MIIQKRNRINCYQLSVILYELKTKYSDKLEELFLLQTRYFRALKI